jgi:hypothetical protein
LSGFPDRGGRPGKRFFRGHFVKIFTYEIENIKNLLLVYSVAPQMLGENVPKQVYPSKNYSSRVRHRWFFKKMLDIRSRPV